MISQPNPDLMARAIARHQAGHLEEAAGLCRRVLATEPLHGEALYLLGAICYQTGGHDEAIGCLTRALSVSPGRPEILNVLGLALSQADRLEEAETSFRLAIEAAPNFSQAHNNLGSLLKRQGRLTEAATLQRQAVALDPANPAGHYNLGNTLRAMDDLEGAAACFHRALEIQPDSVDALVNLGEALHLLNRPGEAVDVFRRAAALAPDDAGVRTELGDALQTLGRLEEAVEAYQEALAKDGQSSRALYGAGCAQVALERYARAISTFQRLLGAQPDHAPTNHNLGKALLGLGRVDEAMEHFRRAAASDPSGPALTALAVSIPGAPGADNRTVLDVRRRLAESLARRPGPEESPPRPAAASADGRLRLAYVSGFFQNRNWMKPVWGLINQHDRQRFEIHLFSDAPASAVRTGYRKHPADAFHDISGLSNEDVARRIAECGIDLLVDLNGYSYVQRLGLFAHRCAPVVVGWFNMYATTGLPAVDWLIGDEQVIPADEEAFYTERIARVAGSYLTFEVDYPVPDVAPPPCCRDERFTFGCLASQYKITPQVAEAWAQILRECPRSRLVLRNATLGSADNRHFVHETFQQLGIAPERIELNGRAEHYAFLETYDRIDLALDPFPYNGGTTTTEAIWQGVPVLTFHGDRWASRTSASILRAGTLGDFVAADREEHIQQAVRWASDPDGPGKLADLRANMRERLGASPVCDTETFTRDMERLYTRMTPRR